MQQKDIEELVKKYHAGQCTAEEAAFLESWYAQWNQKIPVALSPDELAEDLEIISSNVRPLDQPARRIALWPRIAAAASIILCLSFVGYFLLHKQSTQQTAQNQNEIVPGSNKAILLSHGKKYSITDAKNGLIAMQGNTSIRKTADGKLAYSGGKNESVVYDTLIVPRGGQHQLTLADGSIAYLNADTKIRYPESFSGKKRDMELISGEVIMHVKHNAAIEFNFKAKGQLIHDIGTEFDVIAYNDEPGVKTTLIQGVVKVTSALDKTGKILKPGQQAVNQYNSAISVQDADVDEVTAWKNGKFLFNDAALETIMKKVSRWYDVDVVYQDDAMKTKHFSAISARFGNVTELLHNMELTGDVKFAIEGKTIKVLDK